MPELNEEAKKRIASLEKESQKLVKEVELLYTVIGRNYYEKPEGHEEEIEKAAARLDAIKKQIHENRIAILAWKGIRLCPNCGSEVEQGAIFCGECGIRIEAVKEVDENSVLCSRCGAKNEKGKKFCVICGQKLVDIIKAVEGDSAQSPKWTEGELAKAETEEVLVEAKIEEALLETEAEDKLVETKIEEVLVGTETEDRPVEAETKEEPAEEESKPLAEAAATEEGSNEAANHPEADVLASDAASEPVQLSDLAEGAGMPQEDVIFCPECGNRLPADALFCGECGTRIVEEMPVETHQETSAPVGDMPLFCTECGTRLEPGSVFCSECGTPVAAGR